MTTTECRSAVLLLALVAGGCGHRVGDTCNINTDCSPLGDRFCDIAAPGGYCTIEGCDVRLDSHNNLVDSCQNVASESVCVRFFTLDYSKPCDPMHPSVSCVADERCLCASVDASQLVSSGDPLVCNASWQSGPVGAYCSKESTERRWCMLKCNNDGDCRGSGYHCVPPGQNGSEPVPRQLIRVGSDGGTYADDGGTYQEVATGDYSQKFCVYLGATDLGLVDMAGAPADLTAPQDLATADGGG